MPSAPKGSLLIAAAAFLPLNRVLLGVAAREDTRDFTSPVTSVQVTGRGGVDLEPARDGAAEPE
ncbi:hypothetical protein GCM10010533_25540 [Mycolicibacterium pallens]